MTTPTGLRRQLGLLGLAATGICSMLGASVFVVPFMIQRAVEGIGFGAVRPGLAAIAYAVLASAMPRADGSYIYASRGLHPYLGFVASFSQWFGLSIVIGVIAYVIVPFLRDIASAMGFTDAAVFLDSGIARIGISMAMIWGFVGVNVRGAKFYERTLIAMMFVMFALGAIVIVAGFSFNHADFAAALMEAENRSVPTDVEASFRLPTFLAAAALLFASFIG